jgi:hypothetical protein
MMKEQRDVKLLLLCFALCKPFKDKVKTAGLARQPSDFL